MTLMSEEEYSIQVINGMREMLKGYPQHDVDLYLLRLTKSGSLKRAYYNSVFEVKRGISDKIYPNSYYCGAMLAYPDIL